VHGRRAVELMLDRPELVIRGPIRDVVHPAVSEQRSGGLESPGRSRMLIRIELLEQPPDLLQQLAAVLVLLERVDTLPGDVHRTIPRDQIADILLAILPG